MSQEHWYYLHENGDLIHKNTYPGEDNSPFVKRIWALDPNDREKAWVIVLESLALGANINRVKTLADYWGCDLKDLLIFFIKVEDPTDMLKNGAEIFMRDLCKIDPNEWWSWLTNTPAGKSPNFDTMPGKKENNE